jgi:hypothetical protein
MSSAKENNKDASKNRKVHKARNNRGHSLHHWIAFRGLRSRLDTGQSSACSNAQVQPFTPIANELPMSFFLPKREDKPIPDDCRLRLVHVYGEKWILQIWDYSGMAQYEQEAYSLIPGLNVPKGRKQEE